MTGDEAQRQAALHDLVESLIRALGNRLESVVLYGSAARGDWHQGSSDHNVAVVVTRLDAAALEALTAPLLKWIKTHEPPPRLLTRALIAASLDVFPIEYLDLRTHHVVLHGGDPFAGLEIGMEPLRLQCEREMREKLMRLGEGYVVAHRSRRLLRALLLDSYSSFTALFRGCLALWGETPPAAAAGVAAAFCARAGLEPAPFAALDLLRRGGSGAPRDLKTLFSGYYDALNRAAEAIDGYRAPAGGGTR
jgi:predicted nucleotidyltransferase